MPDLGPREACPAQCGGVGRSALLKASLVGPRPPSEWSTHPPPRGPLPHSLILCPWPVPPRLTVRAGLADTRIPGASLGHPWGTGRSSIPWEEPSSGGNCEVWVLPTAHRVTLGTVIPDLGRGSPGIRLPTPLHLWKGHVPCPYDAQGGHAGFL